MWCRHKIFLRDQYHSCTCKINGCSISIVIRMSCSVADLKRYANYYLLLLYVVHKPNVHCMLCTCAHMTSCGEDSCLSRRSDFLWHMHNYKTVLDVQVWLECLFISFSLEDKKIQQKRFRISIHLHCILLLAVLWIYFTKC